MSKKEEAVQQIRLIEQNIQQLLVQKQAIQSQLIEVESALEELTDGTASWKVVGNIMVKKDASALKEELTKRRDTFQKRIDAFDNQESRLREKAQSLQKQVMEENEDGSD